jgi:hypothetical protein
MSAKRLAFLFGSALFFISSAWAQDAIAWDPINVVSLTAGRAFVPTQTIITSDPFDNDPHIHFGNEAEVAANYSRQLKTYKIFGISAELPVAVYFRMDLHTDHDTIPKDIGALFVTPSVRVNIFQGESVTPWVSVGGGYGRFRESPELLFGAPNPGSTGTNTGVMQFGTGLDVWFWHRWGARMEARDFWSGVPDYDVTTTRTRQHNFYVGVGILHRF